MSETWHSMKRAWGVLAVLAAVGGWTAWAGPVTDNGGPAAPLPPLAEAIRQTGDGEAWRYCGEIPGRPAAAAADLDKAVCGQGWMFPPSVCQGQAGTPEDGRPLDAWAPDDWRLLLAWPAVPGRNGIVMGMFGESQLVEDAVREPVSPPAAGSGAVGGKAAFPPGPDGGAAPECQGNAHGKP